MLNLKQRSGCWLPGLALLALGLLPAVAAQPQAARDKVDSFQNGAPPAPVSRQEPPAVMGEGKRFLMGEGETAVPVVRVSGTPYEMGWHIGRLMQKEMSQFIPGTLAGIQKELRLTTEAMRETWTRTASYGDDRVEQELLGLADGSGLPLATLQAVHAIPLLMPYSCSSIAAWGAATADQHLYQTRNLDWSLQVRAHDFPVVLVYVPARGIPHVVPSFAGMIGAHTGMNARGVVLSEMGDSPAREMPFHAQAPHFTVYFRTLLYDAGNLDQALAIFQAQPLTKRYHLVFGDGQHARRAVKIKAHAPEPPGRQVVIWRDNDPTDEFAPRVLPQVVYNDEGRGAFPILKEQHGQLNGEKLIRLANQIPIKGGNVVNVIYDATALRMWISYAKGEKEAYLRPYNHLDLAPLLK